MLKLPAQSSAQSAQIAQFEQSSSLLSLPLEEGRESERTRESLGSLSSKFEQKFEQKTEQGSEQQTREHKARLAKDPRFAAWTACSPELPGDAHARALGAES
jgi:hypothetical protein